METVFFRYYTGGNFNHELLKSFLGYPAVDRCNRSGRAHHDDAMIRGAITIQTVSDFCAGRTLA
jgi:hypothetical protein